MPFNATLYNNYSFPVIHLEDSEHNTLVEVFSKGALLNAFHVQITNSNYLNIVDGYGNENEYKENANWFKSAKLSPFVCRLKNGQYEYDGRHLNTGKYFIGDEAMHGLLYDALFEIKSFGSAEEYAFANFYFLYNNTNEGFPFKYECTVIYKLFADNLLSVETIVRNLSDMPLPLNDGWHPYFTLGDIVDNYELQINSGLKLALDEKLLPTGELVSDNRFEYPMKLKNIDLDHSFLLKDFSRAACSLKNNKDNITLEIYADDSYPYLQVFTPDHRKSIALENLSSAPDSFNNKMHLIMLKPRETKRFSVRYKISV